METMVKPIRKRDLTDEQITHSKY